MKIALFAAFICLAAALPNVRQIQNLSHPARVAGEYLVVLHSPVRISNLQYVNGVVSRMQAISPQITIINAFTNLMAPILHVKSSSEAAMSQLFQMAEVESIDVEMVQHMIEQCASDATGSRLWGLSRSSARAQPDFGSARYSYSSNDGSGVRAYVLDTSIRLTHVDFGGRAEFGANFVGGSNDDNNGHGTHCAGTIGGTQYGVSKAPTLVAVKVLGDSGSGSFAGIISGIDWVVADLQTRGVRGVISMSLGGGANTGLDSAVNSADAANVPVVVSAGNSNADACNQSPARATGAITVGATDINDVLSSFSSYGSCVNILAPGTGILSASHLSDTGERTLSGTSMSCPHVAGRVASYLAANPNASSAQVKSFLDSSSTPDVIDLRGTGSATPNLLMYASCA